MVIRIGNEYDVVKIVTNYLPTIDAVRNLDWMAYSEDWQTGDTVGTGATEQDAINDLREKLESGVYTWEVDRH